MKPTHKLILIFSIIFLIIISIGIALTILSFGYVPIGQYGILINYFSPEVDMNYYTNGLYHKRIGYYFIMYPSTKQYIIDQQITVTSMDLERIKIQYTVCYRLDPNKLIKLYEKVALNYEDRIIAIVNNVISTYVNGLTQSGVLDFQLQKNIVSTFNSNGRAKINDALSQAIIVQAIWIKQIDFLQSEQYYAQAYNYGKSQSQSYQEAVYNLTIANLEVNSLNNSLINKKYAFLNEMQLYGQRVYNQQIQSSYKKNNQKIVQMSQLFNMSRIFQIRFN